MKKLQAKIFGKVMYAKHQAIRFLKNEDGVNTLETVIISAVLVAVALIFRKELMNFVNEVVKSVFGNKEDVLNGLPS